MASVKKTEDRKSSRRKSKVQTPVSSDVKKKLMVAAIDFGTTYSGWAFSFYHDFQSEPTKIYCKQWNSGTFQSAKTPTTVLVKPDGDTLEAFGYEAEDRFADLASKGEDKGYYFFQHFKMMLYDNEKLTRRDELEDTRGRKLPAKCVFSMVIRYLKDDILRESNKQFVGEHEDDDIQWVLTVPAIWNARAKQFMRECAVEAGIKSSNLLIALEPEAASLYCKHLCLQRQKDTSKHIAYMSAFEQGSRYMLVDAGGGTVDIVLHQVGVDRSLEEIYTANGGNWGGTMVDNAFFKLLTKIVGKEVMTKFKKEHLDDYFDFQREFEMKKRHIKLEPGSVVRLKYPLALASTCLKVTNVSFADKVEQSFMDGNMRIQSDKILIKHDLMKSLFDKTIKAIIDHMYKVFEDPKTQGTHTILMVGGFSESPMLLEAIETAFMTYHVVVPPDSGTCVLKGAVIYGHCNQDVKSRLSPYAYGLKLFKEYDPTIYSRNRMIKIDGENMVAQCFHPLIQVGEKLVPNTISGRYPILPLDDNPSLSLQFFASKNVETRFVDEKGCFYLGEVIVDCRDEWEKSCGVDVRLVLGGTEFEVNVVNQNTNKVTKAKFNFLD